MIAHVGSRASFGRKDLRGHFSAARGTKIYWNFLPGDPRKVVLDLALVTRVCLVGSSGCGKTALLTAFRHTSPPPDWINIVDQDSALSNLPAELLALIAAYYVAIPVLDPFPSSFPPRVGEFFLKTVLVGDIQNHLVFTETRSSTIEDNRLRPLTYKNADIFLLCFSYAEASLQNCLALYDEINTAVLFEEAATAPLFLVGLCSDVESKKISEGTIDLVVAHPGGLMVIKQSFQVSAKTSEGVPLLLDAIAKAAVKLAEERLTNQIA